MLREIGNQRHPGIGAQRLVIRHRQIEVAVRPSRTRCQLESPDESGSYKLWWGSTVARVTFGWRASVNQYTWAASKGVPARSFGDSVGSPSSGQRMPISGSFHWMQRSSSGA